MVGVTHSPTRLVWRVRRLRSAPAMQPGYTIPTGFAREGMSEAERTRAGEDVWFHRIWGSGVGVTERMRASSTLRKHRELVLRALTAVLCGPMYRSLPTSAEAIVADRFTAVRACRWVACTWPMAAPWSVCDLFVLAQAIRAPRSARSAVLCVCDPLPYPALFLC